MLRAALTLLTLLSAVISVQANDYPVRTLRIIVPFAAGGGTDVLARIVAQRLQDRWGQSVIIENQAGGSGGIGTKAVMRAAPDGYTLLMASTGALMAAATSHGGSDDFDVNQHLAPITLIAAPPYVITIHPKIGAATVTDLVRIARERGVGSSLTFGSSGAGAASHLTGVLFQKETGIEMLHVAYRGTGPAVNDLLGGHIDVMFAPPQTVQPLVEAGKLKAIATTGLVRSPLFPDLPTVAESGVPGFEVRRLVRTSGTGAYARRHRRQAQCRGRGAAGDGGDPGAARSTRCGAAAAGTGAVRRIHQRGYCQMDPAHARD